MESSVLYEGDLNLKATELRLGLPGTDEPEKQNPVTGRTNKRSSPDSGDDHKGSKGDSDAKNCDCENPPAAKAQVVGWPPVRSFRKNSFLPKKTEAETGMFVKVSMDGAPYLRKIDLKIYKGYSELLKALENMFKLTIGKKIDHIDKNTDKSAHIGYRYLEPSDSYGSRTIRWRSIDRRFLTHLYPDLCGVYSEREGYKGSEYAPTYEDKDGDWMLVGDVPWDMFITSCKRLRIMKGSEAKGLTCGA